MLSTSNTAIHTINNNSAPDCLAGRGMGATADTGCVPDYVMNLQTHETHLGLDTKGCVDHREQWVVDAYTTNIAAQIAQDRNTGLWGSTWEELFRGDALGEGGIRQGLACQAQLFPLHAVHSLEVAPCYLHVLHTQLASIAAVTSAIACAHCNCCLGFCSDQIQHLMSLLM